MFSNVEIVFSGCRNRVESMLKVTYKKVIKKLQKLAAVLQMRYMGLSIGYK
jgi:hypothetical protein